jgi:hypothetical protein
MKLNMVKPKLHPEKELKYWFTWTTLPIFYSDNIKDLEVFLDSKLHFRIHVNSIFSQCIKLLGIVRSIAFSFSSPDCSYILQFTPDKSKLEYASGILLLILMPTNWWAYSRAFQPFVLTVHFVSSITVMLLL